MGVTSPGRGCGTTFYFELPLYDSKSEQLQYLALPDTPPATSLDETTKRNDSSHSAFPTADISPEGEDAVRCDNEIIYGTRLLAAFNGLLRD